MTTVLVDYGSGNLRSAAKAFKRVARGEEIVVSNDPQQVAAADRIVLPGVGAFADCLRGLAASPGLLSALEQAVRHRYVPFLGICVGMQLLADYGYEHGRSSGLGWIPGAVEALIPDDPALKIPHMGWNDLIFEHSHPLLEGLAEGSHAYFVHGYHFRCAEPGDCLARVEYGGPVTVMVGRDNMVGVQFHPEKSQAFGLGLIANFLNWNP